MRHEHMRNISASLTTAQIRQSMERVKRGLRPVKDVTRRLGWLNLKAGERLQVCEKCQGLKPGESLVRLCVVEVISARREPLRRMIDELFYGIEEVGREGFSYAVDKNQWPSLFVRMFCTHMSCEPETVITRIEFKYILPA